MQNAGLALHRSKLQLNVAELIFTALDTQINHNVKLVFPLAATYKLNLATVGFHSPKCRQIFKLFFSDDVTFDADGLCSRSVNICSQARNVS